MSHTVETVKRDLPQVQVKIGKKVVTANVSGRLNQFATVWTRDNLEGWEFSWKTIARSLNTGKPLSI